MTKFEILKSHSFEEEIQNLKQHNMNCKLKEGCLLENWSSENGIQLNVSKTSILQFYNQRQPDFSSLLRKGDNHLVKFRSASYLSITITENLNLEAHFDSIVSF